MSSFKQFAQAIGNQFTKLSKGELFVVDTTDIWQTYLSAFPEGTNPIFKTRTEHDCNCCKQFVRRCGNLISIQNGKRISVWDVPGLPEPYATVAARMSDLVHQAPCTSVFRTKEHRYGAEKTRTILEGTNHFTTFNHFVGNIEPRHRPRNPDTERGTLNTKFNTSKRALTDLSLQAAIQVLELIDSNSIYRGDTYRHEVNSFITRKKEFDKLTEGERDIFIWQELDHPVSYFRTSSIGTLVEDLSKGKDLEEAVRMYEAKVAPQNYKRTTALITDAMVKKAAEKLEELGLESALHRRHAVPSDVSVNDVLFVDNSFSPKLKDGIAGILAKDVKATTPDLKNPELMSITDFINNILPTTTSLQAYVSGDHLGKFMTVTAPVTDSKKLFKWNNDFAWTYIGDVTDSIKQRVKSAGGNVTADFRVSLGWFNHDDLDLHAITPSGSEICYYKKGNPGPQGHLDVDMNAGSGKSRTPVENICWNGKFLNGTYKVFVNNYSRRETIDVGFELELEFKGQVFRYKFEKAVPNGSNIDCLEITVKEGNLANIRILDKDLKGGGYSQEQWGVKTETLVPVQLLMNSPNHWNDQKIGAKHWFFILKDCVNPDDVRGFYNEYLHSDLDPHRKVFEVLGARTKCPFSPNQLSGIGFTAARNDSLVVVAKGKNFQRVIKLNF